MGHFLVTPFFKTVKVLLLIFNEKVEAYLFTKYYFKGVHLPHIVKATVKSFYFKSGHFTEKLELKAIPRMR